MCATNNFQEWFVEKISSKITKHDQLIAHAKQCASKNKMYFCEKCFNIHSDYRLLYSSINCVICDSQQVLCTNCEGDFKYASNGMWEILKPICYECIDNNFSFNKYGKIWEFQK